jgi:hypothetical protein
MKNEEWNQLKKMHDQISQSGICAFDTAYLEKYSELLARSLEGKGDAVDGRRPISTRPDHTMV